MLFQILKKSCLVNIVLYQVIVNSRIVDSGMLAQLSAALIPHLFSAVDAFVQQRVRDQEEDQHAFMIMSVRRANNA